MNLIKAIHLPTQEFHDCRLTYRDSTEPLVEVASPGSSAWVNNNKDYKVIYPVGLSDSEGLPIYHDDLVLLTFKTRTDTGMTEQTMLGELKQLNGIYRWVDLTNSVQFKMHDLVVGPIQDSRTLKGYDLIKINTLGDRIFSPGLLEGES